MLGLSGYSSSEDDADEPTSRPDPKLPTEKPQDSSSNAQSETRNQPRVSNEINLSISAQGPALPVQASYPSLEEPADDLTSQEITSLVHSLTMPPLPNFDIPPSPPGSPPPGSSAKFAQFLNMKKPSSNYPTGVHFNARLPDSSSLKNPAFLDKMMEKAGISFENSYALAEPTDLALPTVWPEWAQADELNKAQKRLAKKKERPAGERVQFVPEGGSR